MTHRPTADDRLERGKPDGGGTSGDGWPTGPALARCIAQWAATLYGRIGSREGGHLRLAKSANRGRLAAAAIGKLDRAVENRTSIPVPSDEVRAGTRKIK